MGATHRRGEEDCLGNLEGGNKLSYSGKRQRYSTTNGQHLEQSSTKWWVPGMCKEESSIWRKKFAQTVWDEWSCCSLSHDWSVLNIKVDSGWLTLRLIGLFTRRRVILGYPRVSTQRYKLPQLFHLLPSFSFPQLPCLPSSDFQLWLPSSTPNFELAFVSSKFQPHCYSSSLKLLPSSASPIFIPHHASIISCMHHVSTNSFIFDIKPCPSSFLTHLSSTWSHWSRNFLNLLRRVQGLFTFFVPCASLIFQAVKAFRLPDDSPQFASPPTEAAEQAALPLKLHSSGNILLGLVASLFPLSLVFSSCFPSLNRHHEARTAACQDKFSEDMALVSTSSIELLDSFLFHRGVEEQATGLHNRHMWWRSTSQSNKTHTQNIENQNQEIQNTKHQDTTWHHNIHPSHEVTSTLCFGSCPLWTGVIQHKLQITKLSVRANSDRTWPWHINAIKMTFIYPSITPLQRSVLVQGHLWMASLTTTLSFTTTTSFIKTLSFVTTLSFTTTASFARL